MLRFRIPQDFLLEKTNRARVVYYVPSLVINLARNGSDPCFYVHQPIKKGHRGGCFSPMEIPSKIIKKDSHRFSAGCSPSAPAMKNATSLSEFCGLAVIHRLRVDRSRLGNERNNDDQLPSGYVKMGMSENGVYPQ